MEKEVHLGKQDRHKATRTQQAKKMLNQTDAFNLGQKTSLRRMLKRFEGRKLEDKEFRIL